MTDTKYNGWTNYETWCVNLWLDEEQYYTSLDRRDLQKDAYDLGQKIRMDIENRLEQHNPQITGMFMDLLNSCLRVVSWHEIAGHYIEEARAEDEA